MFDCPVCDKRFYVMASSRRREGVCCSHVCARARQEMARPVIPCAVCGGPGGHTKYEVCRNTTECAQEYYKRFREANPEHVREQNARYNAKRRGTMPKAPPKPRMRLDPNSGRLIPYAKSSSGPAKSPSEQRQEQARERVREFLKASKPKPVCQGCGNRFIPEEHGAVVCSMACATKVVLAEMAAE